MIRRSSAEIKSEISRELGFFPPFFEPALKSSVVLESLWQQTLLSYIRNPIPNLFKEKLAALLARYCSEPYCLLSHSCALKPLGMSAADVLDLLEQPPLGSFELAEKIKNLSSLKLKSWPNEGSELEEQILLLSVAIYLDEGATDCRAQLRSLLPEELYDFLILFIAYNKTALGWAEAHPGLRYEEDGRYQTHYEGLVAESSKLNEFFLNYQERVKAQATRRFRWLTQENKHLVSEERLHRATIENEQARLLRVFNSMPNPVAVLSGPDHLFTFANAAYREGLLGGLSVMGKTVAQILPETVEQGFVKLLDEVYATGNKYVGTEVPIELSQADGTRKNFFVNFLYEPILDSDGMVEGVVAVVTDVTEQVMQRRLLIEAAHAVAVESQKLDLIVREAPIGVALMTGPELRFEIANEQWRSLVPGERDYIGRVYDEVYPELIQIGLADRIREVLVTGVTLTASELLVPVRLSDGAMQDRYYDVSYIQMTDAEDKAYGVFSMATDVTLRVHTNLELASERQKLEAMIALSPIGIGLMRGEELVFERVNQRFTELVGPREYLGRPWAEVYSELPNSPLIGIMLDVLRTGTPYDVKEMPIRVEISEGVFEDRYYDFTYIQVLNGNREPFGIYLLCADVSEQVKVRKNIEISAADLKVAKEDAERANILKSAFLANMSHEIRTPLGAIIGFADLMRDPKVTASERSNYINIMLRNGEQLSVIINDILDLSKVEAGHLTLEYIDTDHHKISSEVMSLMHVQAREKDLALDYSFDDSTPTLITSDPTRVRQILLNLVGNAIKFTQFGAISVRAFGCKTDSGQAALCFEVRDTGIGMSSAQMERLFQTFSQADETTTRRFGGTGLGLALSRRLARAMGGDVTVTTSVEGSGTTFLVKIADEPHKRSAVEDTFKVEMKRDHVVGDKALAGLRILVVDDAPDNRALIWRYLTKHGASVESVENGLLGFRSAIGGNFDLVLMDIQMPVMDGYTATQKLRDAGYQKPIIALTAHAMNDIRKKALNVGYTDHLTKPINPSELIRTIVMHTNKN